VISLSDKQLEIVMDAAADLPVEKRALLLERVAARLRLAGPRFNERDFEDAVRLANHNLRIPVSREAGKIQGTNYQGPPEITHPRPS
jgi:hypothetical protein